MELSKFRKGQSVFCLKNNEKVTIKNYGYLVHLDMFYYLVVDKDNKEVFAYETELKESK